jgi:hypothetical protein
MLPAVESVAPTLTSHADQGHEINSKHLLLLVLRLEILSPPTPSHSPDTNSPAAAVRPTRFVSESKIMHHALFSVAFVSLFASITAREYSPKGSTWLLMKGMDAPIQDSVKLPAAALDSAGNPSVHPTAEDSNTQPATTVPVGANDTSSGLAEAGSTHPANITTAPTAPPASNPNSTAPANNNGPAIPDVPAPEQSANSTCHKSSTGKNVTFSDRACWL